MGGFRCASGVSARFWAQVRPCGAGLGPGSPVARWWRGSGVRPSRDHHGRVPGGRSDLALRRCHVTKGRHALHLREPLWGFDSRWSTKSLSHPRPSRCGVLGRSRQPNGSLSLTALCDRTAAFPAGGVWIPGSECSPLQGTPSFFASPGMECGGSSVHGSGRRGYGDVGTVGYVFCFGQIVVSRFGVRSEIKIPAFAGMTERERGDWGGRGRVGPRLRGGFGGAGDSEEGGAITLALSQRERGFCLGEWARGAGWVGC